MRTPNHIKRVIELIAEIRALEIRPTLTKRKFEKCGFPEMKDLLRPQDAISDTSNISLNPAPEINLLDGLKTVVPIEFLSVQAKRYQQQATDVQTVL